MINVKVSIDRLIVTPLTNRLIISDSVGFVYCDFIFDDEWQNLTKTATFSAGEEAYDVLLNGDRCEIPHELLTDGAEIRIAVKGYAEDVIVVTKAMNSAIKVWAAGIHEGTQPGAYTPELWEQVLQSLDSKQNTLVAGQNITLEQQTDGTVKISATGGGGGGSSEAADIHIEDEEDYYTSNNVEGALQEVGQDIGELGADIQDIINDVTEIEDKISPYASDTNKLVSASEMGDAISSVEAKQLYKTASQGSFATKAELTSATVFYNADGTTATPTKNDVAYVLADESHDNKLAKYVVASINPTVWGFVISISETSFTQAQNDAINSGITSAKRSGYDAHVENGNIHVTTTDKANWDGKYEKPSTGIPASDLASGVIPSVPTQLSQLTADSTHRTVTDTEKLTWNGKQNAISDLATIRSGAAAGATAYQKPSGGIPTSDIADREQATEIGIDDNVTEGSNNLITSDAVYKALSQFPTEVWNGGSY